jgi:lysyl-tRNA synthetase class 2
MSAGSRTEPDHATVDWRPTASLTRLRLRAALRRRLRGWFDDRGILEVDTPALSRAAATDPASESLGVAVGGIPHYLHTSPEFPMKRLLAAGSGDVYQLCRVFRDGERGRRHRPEFTLLEYYRLGYDERRLADEVDGLLRHLLDGYLDLGATRRLSYAEAMAGHAGVDPEADPPARLAGRLAAAGIDVPPAVAGDRDALLDLLLATVVEPSFDRAAPTILFDFPASQAALARLRPGPPPVAARFELFLGGMELANGFHELADADEQRRRFEADLNTRGRLGLATPPMDQRLLAALADGLPDCAGVAIGFDRVVMLAAGCDTIDEVISFGGDSA